MNLKRALKGIQTGAWLTLAIGICCSIGAAWMLSDANDRQINQELEIGAKTLAEDISARFERYQYGLRGARAAVLAMGSANITRSDFHRYALTRDLEREFPGSRGFGFIRRVLKSEETPFLQRARADGWPDFSLRHLSPNDGERFVIQYIEPVQQNRQAVGLDIASEKNRRTAAWEAVQTGECRLTGPITLVQATGKPLQSFLILLPIYGGWQTPNSIEEREASAIGWSYAPLITEEVLRGLVDAAAVNFTLADITDSNSQSIFFASAAEASSSEDKHHVYATLEVFGRTWRLDYRANGLFVKRFNQVSPRFILVGGSLLSLLLAYLVSILQVSRQRRRDVANAQAWMSAIVENSVDAIIGQKIDGTITSWNPGAEHLFGYTQDDVLGFKVADLIVPSDRDQGEADILEHIVSDQRVESFDTQCRRKDGNLRDISVTVSPIQNGKGQIIGVSKTVRDVTARKAYEAHLQSINLQLETEVVKRTRDLMSSLETTRGILDTATTPIITVDSFGIIRSCNPATEKTFGYVTEELIGRNVSILMPERFAAKHDQYLESFRRVDDRAIGINREIEAMRRDGSVFPVQISLGVMVLEGERMVVGILSDLTEQQRQRDVLTQMRDHFALATDAAELGIWSLELPSRSLEWNDRMFKIYGHPLSLREQGLSYEHWRMRVHPDDLAEVEAKFEAVIEGAGLYDPIFRVVHANGQIRFVQAAARVSCDPQGNPVRVTGINIDITHERELQADLLIAKELADSASAAKSSFLANMSHEIRTPMNAVLGMLLLARQTELTERQRDYLDKAQGAAKALLGLLNDILDYSKVEAGKLELEQHAFAVESLMQDLAAVLAGNLGEKDVEVVFDIDTSLPAALVGDRLRLQQILINLAGNALKFTEHGQVMISLRMLERREASVRIRVEVRDSGIGITPGQLARIFDSFTQAEASTTRRFGGTGLGLFICRHLVELMGGKLHVESDPGQGSNFWFELELPVDEDQTLRDSFPTLQPHLRVLIVDDNSISGLSLKQTIESIGWNAELVDGALRAVGKIVAAVNEGKPFDLVLMDWRMPEVDGVAAAKLVQSLSGDQSSPVIIMITAYGRGTLATLKENHAAPFASFLTKPLTPQQLITAIAEALNGESGNKGSALELTLGSRLVGLRILVVEDNPVNRQVAEELLSKEGAAVELARDGAEGAQAVVTKPDHFDLVLMDMQMPVVDGPEATRWIRATSGFENLPIIAMTANASEMDKRACIEAGMNAHVPKPFDMEVLVSTILQQLHHETERRKQIVNEQTTDSLLENRKAILRRFSGNEGLVQRLLDSFGSQMESLIAQLREQANDLNATAELMHTIKGTAGTMGCLALAGQASRYEAYFLETESTEFGGALKAVDLDALERLVGDSLQGLRVMFGSNNIKPDTTVGSVSDGFLRERLGELVELLGAHNMRAIAKLEEIERYQLDIDSEHLDALRKAIQRLDFDTANKIGQELLNGM
ncbi:hybrid sensor histidine kinase/response regulator [Pseudomonas sp. PS02288]|uniref:hybrid sensor histidine kinase/response regulator n=1 Tax=Pseudomonas sp. PS02288 TaxID=2991443 RepID=UPI00249B5A10|nr:hybrid sensor histidine kinase/response regulator [Pseudomonas sp. PS02288]